MNTNAKIWFGEPNLKTRLYLVQFFLQVQRYDGLTVIWSVRVLLRELEVSEDKVYI